MKITTKQLEEILDNLASAKSRETFFVKYFMSAENKQIRELIDSIPEKYIDELIEIELTELNERELPEIGKAHNDKINTIKWGIAAAAELSGRYEKAAHLYKALNHIPGAISQARLAGLAELAELADKWAEEYIQGALANASENSARQKECIYEVAKRAREVGMLDRAQKIVRNYIGKVDSYLDHKPDGLDILPDKLEEMADFAANYELAEEAESFYRAAMEKFEEKGLYDCALRVARKIKDSEKIEFYDILRYITASKERRAEIDEDRDEERDALK